MNAKQDLLLLNIAQLTPHGYSSFRFCSVITTNKLFNSGKVIKLTYQTKKFVSNLAELAQLEKILLF